MLFAITPMQSRYAKSNHHVFLALLLVVFGVLFWAARPDGFISRLWESRALSSLSVLKEQANMSAALPSPTLKSLTVVRQLFGSDAFSSLQQSADESEQEFFLAIAPCLREKLGDDFSALQDGSALPTVEMKQKAAACLNDSRVKGALGAILKEREQEASALEALKPLLPVFNFLAR